MAEVQGRLPVDPLNQSLIAEECAIQRQLQVEHSKADMDFRQRSKIRWLADGDTNSKFFYSQIKSRWRTNAILKVCLYDGTVSDNDNDIKERSVKYYVRLFNEDYGSSPLSPIPFKKKLNEKAHRWLCRPISMEEVTNVFFSGGIGKSPGPDNFGFGFYQNVWDIIKFDLLAAL